MDVDGRLAVQLADRSLEVVVSGQARGLGQPEARLLYSAEVRWRFGHALYALAQGGTQLYPGAEGTLRPVTFVSLGFGEPFAMVLVEARGDPVRAQAVFSQARPEPKSSTPAKAGAAQPPRGAAPIQGAPLLDTPIRNAHLAGKRHPVTGVPFDAEGYPDFRAAGAVKVEVKISYTGSRARDFAAANAAAGRGASAQ